MSDDHPSGSRPRVNITDSNLEGGGGGVNIESGAALHMKGTVIRKIERDAIRSNGPVYIDDSLIEDIGGHAINITLPEGLRREIEADIKAGADGRRIAEKFSSALAKYGRSVAGLAAFAANSTVLIAWFQALG